MTDSADEEGVRGLKGRWSGESPALRMMPPRWSLPMVTPCQKTGTHEVVDLVSPASSPRIPRKRRHSSLSDKHGSHDFSASGPIKDPSAALFTAAQDTFKATATANREAQIPEIWNTRLAQCKSG